MGIMDSIKKLFGGEKTEATQEQVAPEQPTQDTSAPSEPIDYSEESSEENKEEV